MTSDRKAYSFFYKQPHFSVEPGVAIGSARNEADSCYKVGKVFLMIIGSL